jgi:hypothetical protein
MEIIYIGLKKKSQRLQPLAFVSIKYINDVFWKDNLKINNIICCRHNILEIVYVVIVDALHMNSWYINFIN